MNKKLKKYRPELIGVVAIAVFWAGIWAWSNRPAHDVTKDPGYEDHVIDEETQEALMFNQKLEKGTWLAEPVRDTETGEIIEGGDQE